MRLQNTQKKKKKPKAKQLTEQVCRLYFQYTYSIYNRKICSCICVSVSVSLCLYVCLCVRLTSVTDKSKRQHFRFFFSVFFLFFDQKTESCWLGRSPHLHWIDIEAVRLLDCIVVIGVVTALVVFFFLYYYLDRYRYRYLFFSRPNLPACLSFLAIGVLICRLLRLHIE